MRLSTRIVRFLSLVFVVLASITAARATHLRAGEITVELIDCASRTYRITITVYTNTGSSVLFGGRAGEEDLLDFGDGSEPILVPETENTPRPDLGPNIGTASYSIIHTYGGGGEYIISYREPNRNEGVLNMDNSVNTRFYLETKLIIDPFAGCDNSAKLSIAPIDQGCTGVAFFHNPGAYDPDPGDSVSYEMVIPFSDTNLSVLNYRDPNNQQFYTDFNTGNEAGTGQPTFSINAITGTLLWDAPGAPGEYNIAFVVRSWRKVRNTNVWREMGFVRRDMQIIVKDCDNDRPDLTLPEDVCVVAGTTLQGQITGFDVNNDPVKIEAFSNILEFPFNQSPATFTPEPAFRPQPSILNFEWKTICAHVNTQPYQVVFKVSDDPPTGPTLTTFKTWAITVIGPPPVWTNVPVLSGNTATLDWEDYACASQAKSMQIWRKVASTPYTPGECETGISEFLGYELIATVDIGQTTFEDSGFAPGAQYCYRLVALYPEGSESIMSDEVCFDPLPSESPIITHVTVDKTSDTEGRITIAWNPPEVGVAPFEYEIYRGDGFAGTPTIPVIPGRISDTVVVDLDLNTRDNIYNYFIVSYDDNGIKDTSAIASSVRLEARSQLQKIELSWSAFVPWSNYLPNERHDVYRGPSGSMLPSDLVKIGEADVFAGGLFYADNGPLEESQEYCYLVVTKGGYGSQPGEPFENYSQIVCATPSDTIPPCQINQIVALNGVNCDESPDVNTCQQNVFENRIAWNRPNVGDCDNDIAYYHVYVSNVMGGEFTLHPNDKNNIRDTLFVDNNLTSYARCYRISAVDRSGNEGPLSDPFCVDNCPYYELPNLLTPDGDGCNDLFSAFNDRDPIIGEDGSPGSAGIICTEIPVESQARCARFVDAVTFKVFNRWGKEVYNYKSGGERTIYIDWDGRDSNGKELSTGVYYYVADVTFISINPSKRHKTIKSWVHIVR